VQLAIQLTTQGFQALYGINAEEHKRKDRFVLPQLSSAKTIIPHCHAAFSSSL
jgi:hypothetical protein